MSNTVKLPTCPKCGIPIPAEAPQGLCPKCVLLGAATATEQGVPATATSEIPSIERMAAAFPHLEILELIGRGGMGFVFKARQPHLDRFVALKLLPDKLAKDAMFAERFNREGRVLAKLNHPNIVSVFDFGQAGGFYYLSMEYVDGVNLRQAMRAGRFSPAEALALVPKVCEALQYAHEQGILHRDIKPENILLDTKGRVKIADFGIAKLVGEDQTNITLTNTGAALGTPHYMAPEQLEKPATVDHRADIYSLGVVFYEMLTGELPIGRFAAPSSKTPVNTTVDDVVFRTLEKDRERRFQSAGEMKTQVEHLGDFPPGDPTVPGAHENFGPQGTVVVLPPAPRWVKPVAASFLVFSALGLIATIQSLSHSRFELNLLMLLAFTSAALLTRSNALRKAAIAVNAIGVMLPWLSAFQVATALDNGMLALNWKSSLAGHDASMGKVVLFAFLEMSLWAGGLLVLLKRDTQHHFRQPPNRPLGFGNISRWSLYGFLLVGVSLPVPFAVVVTLITRGDLGPGHLPAALTSVALPGLGGTLLGWLGLNEIRESRGRVKGLPLAMFATLFWPLLIVIAGTAMSLNFERMRTETPMSSIPFLLLAVLMPVGTITFAIWAVYATAHWGRNEPTPQHRRGILKWIFVGLLVAGFSMVLVTARHRETRRPLAPTGQAAIAASPMIQFTFTTVDLREENGARWLAMDYVEQVRGDCQHTFRYDARVPGFGAQTFKQSFMSDAKNGFQPVMHQRVMWKLPDKLAQSGALSLRDLVAKEWVGKSVAIEPGDERVLFKSLVPDGGTLAAAVGVRLNSDRNASSAAQKAAASAELWAPTPASGEKPKLNEILQEARTLTEEGRHEEALQRHIWYHNHALELDDSQAGVRLSYALADWMKLARHYPKAKEALVEIVDRATQAFARGEGHYGLFAEVNAINGHLGRQKETLALFESIQSQDHKLASQCYWTVEDMLVEKGDYALCESFIPDFQKRFETIRTVRERTLQLTDRTPEANRSSLRQHAQQTFIKDARKLVEILVGVGRNTEAAAIRDQAVAVLDVPELRSAITDAEEKVAKHADIPKKL